VWLGSAVKLTAEPKRSWVQLTLNPGVFGFNSYVEPKCGWVQLYVESMCIWV
jgi:hypothetical protein